MSRSSIFNFESLQGFSPGRPKALLVAAALVLCLEIGLRLAPEKWLFVSYTRSGFFTYMQNEVVPKFEEPRIAIFGTSHAADAFVPDQLEAQLGLPPFSVANCGIFGARPNEWLDLYQRNRAKFSKLKLLVIAPDEWTFSSGAGADEHLSLYASLADRWNYVQPSESPPHPELKPKDNEERAAEKLEAQRMRRNRLLADYVFQTRVRLPDLPMALVKWLRLGEKRTPEFDEHHMVRSDRARITSKVEEVKDPRNYHERIRNFYKHFDSHPLYLRYVEDLARLAKEDGVRLVIVQLPNRRSYQDEVDKLFPEEYAQHMRATQELADRLGVKSYLCKYPEDITVDRAAGNKKLTDMEFADYCHMSMTGASMATEWLGGIILRNKLLEK